MCRRSPEQNYCAYRLKTRKFANKLGSWLVVGLMLLHTQSCSNYIFMFVRRRSIIKNNTWDLVKLPPNTRPISAKWVYKINPRLGGVPDRFKARIVARGYEQKHGVNFQETFALTIRWKSIRLIIALAAHLSTTWTL